MSDAVFNFQFDKGLKVELASAAKVSDRTGAQLLRDFLRGSGRCPKLEDARSQLYSG